MENKIYFPRFYGQSIVFYSLETDDNHSLRVRMLSVFIAQQKGCTVIGSKLGGARHFTFGSMSSSYIEYR